jgi:YHS domain-containing protein
MKMTWSVAGVALVMMAGGMVRGQEALGAGQAADAQAAKKQTVCPVMGGEVNTSIFADANGKRVYFCCNGCPAAFKKDPAKYIAKLEKDGVTLDKAPAADEATKKPAQNGPAAATEGGCCK